MFGRRRRQRREFAERAEVEVALAQPAVHKLAGDVGRLVASAERDIAALPGAAARCPACGRRMRMRKVKEGKRWWTMWSCPGCDRLHRPADFPEAARLGGWR